MDRFEQELVRMMREEQEVEPYEDRHRHRLHAGVQARKRARTAWTAAGSVLTAAGLCVALLVLAGSFSRGGPAGPRPLPLPLVSAGSVTMTSPGRPASTAAKAPAPDRLSTPGPVLGPARVSATRPAPRPGAGGPVG